MDDAGTSRFEQVRQWLAAHVSSFSSPCSVTLSKFAVREDQFSGSFCVSLDDVQIPETFSFGLGANGKPELFLPMFHSPLGVPASYAAVELTPKTASAIRTALERVLPRMKPFGLDWESGELILHTTHRDIDRVFSKSEFLDAMRAVGRHDFTVSVLTVRDQ